MSGLQIAPSLARSQVGSTPKPHATTVALAQDTELEGAYLPEIGWVNFQPKVTVTGIIEFRQSCSTLAILHLFDSLPPDSVLL
jgi:hypothetical protein